jgi:hypothetical protein
VSGIASPKQGNGMNFSSENKDEATIEFMRRTSVDARSPIANVTIPLFNVVGGYLWATGVLLRICDKHFILTAAHVFDKWSARPIPINTTDGVHGSGLFPIGEVTLRRSPTENPSNRFTDDPCDACVCDLTKATANRIVAAGNFRFLDLSQIDPSSKLDPRDWLMVFGYPGALCLVPIAPNALAANACAFATFLYCGERGLIHLPKEARGVAVLLDYGQSTTENDDGRAVPPPNPDNMSGGGIWRIAANGSELDKWNLSDLKLIGIQSAVYGQEQVLRGTRIEHALGIIYRGHEDLRAEMERLFGREFCERWLD